MIFSAYEDRDFLLRLPRLANVFDPIVLLLRDMHSLPPLRMYRVIYGQLVHVV